MKNKKKAKKPGKKHDDSLKALIKSPPKKKGKITYGKSTRVSKK